MVCVRPLEEQVVVAEGDELAPGLGHHHLVLGGGGLGQRGFGEKPRAQPCLRKQGPGGDHDKSSGDDGEDDLAVAVDDHESPPGWSLRVRSFP
jgi:hypothetical protein